MVDAPVQLSVEARRIFDETCRRVDSDHRPSERFAMIIAMYAQAVDEWAQACTAIAVQGVIIQRGERAVSNPQITVRDQAHAKMERLLSELGLSPSSAIAKDEPWDPEAYCDTLADVIADLAAEEAVKDASLASDQPS